MSHTIKLPIFAYPISLLLRTQLRVGYSGPASRLQSGRGPQNRQARVDRTIETPQHTVNVDILHIYPWEYVVISSLHRHFDKAATPVSVLNIPYTSFIRAYERVYCICMHTVRSLTWLTSNVADLQKACQCWNSLRRFAQQGHFNLYCCRYRRDNQSSRIEGGIWGGYEVCRSAWMAVGGVERRWKYRLDFVNAETILLSSQSERKNEIK